MKRWTFRTAVARVVPGDRAHTSRCSNGPGACRAGRMVRVAVAARAVFQFQRLWSAAFQIQRFWNAAARLGSVASRQRAPMRSRNYLLHIVDAIVSHLSFNQPHVSLRDRAFLRSTALAHMTILPLEQRRP